MKIMKSKIRKDNNNKQNSKIMKMGTKMIGQKNINITGSNQKV